MEIAASNWGPLRGWAPLVILFAAWGVLSCSGPSDQRRTRLAEEGAARPTEAPEAAVPPEAATPTATAPAATRPGKSSAADALAKRLREDLARHAASAPAQYPPPEIEHMAGALFAALAAGDEAGAVEMLLNEDEVREFYQPAIAKIILGARNTTLENQWGRFREAAEWREARIEGIESTPVERALRSGAPIPAARQVAEVRVRFTAGERAGTVILKNCIETARGWRALQYEVRWKG